MILSKTIIFITSEIACSGESRYKPAQMVLDGIIYESLMYTVTYMSSSTGSDTIEFTTYHSCLSKHVYIAYPNFYTEARLKI